MSYLLYYLDLFAMHFLSKYNCFLQSVGDSELWAEVQHVAAVQAWGLQPERYGGAQESATLYHEEETQQNG